MAGLIPNASKKTMLEMVLKAGDCTLRLYTNNKTPAAGDVAADYTEASGSGYSAKTLTAASWGVTSANPSVATYAIQTFTFSGALGNVYGYYVTRNSDGKLLFAERPTDAPFPVTSSADTIAVTPTVNLV